MLRSLNARIRLDGAYRRGGRHSVRGRDELNVIAGDTVHQQLEVEMRRRRQSALAHCADRLPNDHAVAKPH